MPQLSKSPSFSKRYPEMDTSGFDIDGQIGCAKTGRLCLAASGEPQIVYDPSTDKVIGLMSSTTENCSTCIHAR